MKRVLLSSEPFGFIANDAVMREMAKRIGCDVVFSEYDGRLAVKKAAVHPYNRQAFFVRAGDSNLFSSRRLLEFREDPIFFELWKDSASILSDCPMIELKPVEIPSGIDYEIRLRDQRETIVERYRIWNTDGLFSSFEASYERDRT